jgi:membrane associated rhomboid family serine protease
MEHEDVWKRRFLLYMGARLIGLAIFFLGIAVAYSNLVRAGGWPQVGAVIAILGVIGGVFAPRLIKKKWERE